MPRRLFAAAIAVAIGGVSPAAAVDVVATVKPVHSLVAGVMAGVGEPALLIAGMASPHTWSLRPSDARRLQGADLVVWVGPTLETPLAKPLAALAKEVKVMTLSETEGVTMLPAREGGPWGDGHDHGHGHGHSHGKKGEAEEVDGHFWLDPRNARAAANAIAERLAGIDAANAGRYRANARAAAAELEALERELAERLAPARGRPFLVFHDAYQYLERRYDLVAVGAITVSPERKPGAKRIRALREQVRRSGAACVFREPQFDPGLVATVTEGTSAKAAVLDPLGAAIVEGPEFYPTLMRGLGAALADCLGGAK